MARALRVTALDRGAWKIAAVGCAAQGGLAGYWLVCTSAGPLPAPRLWWHQPPSLPSCPPLCSEGERFDRARHACGTEVKAITYSAMQVAEAAGDAEVFVIVDI